MDTPSPNQSEAHPIDPTQKHAERYLKKIWISKGCRFIAHRRLKARNHASQLVVSFFSVAVIAASVAILIVSPEQKKLSDLVTVLAINASVFILVLSNLEFAKNYSVDAERMLRGAQVLSKIHDELELSIKTTFINQEELEKFVNRYNRVLLDFEANHEDIDYLYFQAIHPKHFDREHIGRLTRKIRTIQYYWHIWGLYVVLIFIPPILIFLAMEYVPRLVSMPA